MATFGAGSPPLSTALSLTYNAPPQSAVLQPATTTYTPSTTTTSVIGPDGRTYYVDPRDPSVLFDAAYFNTARIDDYFAGRITADPTQPAASYTPVSASILYDTGTGTGGTAAAQAAGFTGGGGTVVPGSPGSGGATGPTVAQQNAQAYLQLLLAGWGLGSLASSLYGLITQGYDATYIAQQVRQTPEYAARFPAMALRQKAGLPPLSEAQYVALLGSYAQVLHTAGLDGYVNPQSLFTQWIGGDVSPAEVQSRAQAAYQAALGEPVLVRSELQRLFGDQAGPAAVAYYLDPNNALPAIQQRLASGEIAGASVRTGYGLLTADEATRLAGEGVSTAQAQSGFAQLGAESQLFGALPGENVANIGRLQQLGAQFEGNAAARLAIQRRQGLRVAAFGGGGSFAESAQGIAGLGAAQQ